MEGSGRLCLDTDVLVDYLRRPSDNVKRIMKKTLEKKISVCTTSINTFEIWLGIHLAPQQMRLLKETEDFLDQLEIVNFNYETSAEAGRVMATLRKSGQTIEIRDLFVGCVCKVGGMPLITRNLKHYKRIHGLNALTPEQIVRKL